MKHAALALMLSLAAAAAAAAPIYRCGAGTYSQVPCTDGTVLESSDPRSAAQRAEAKRIVAAERKAAADLERERKAKEKAAQASAPAAATLSAPLAPPAAASAARDAGKKKGSQTKSAAQADFVAVVPAKRAASGQK